MKYLPYVDLQDDNYNMDRKQQIFLIFLAYLSVLLYLMLLYLAVSNVYKYLYRQKKYKAYPVSLFYAFAIPTITLRIFANIYVVETALY